MRGLTVCILIFAFGCDNEIIIPRFEDDIKDLRVEAALFQNQKLYVDVSRVTSQYVGEVNFSVLDADVTLYENDIPIEYLNLDTAFLRRQATPVLGTTRYVSEGSISLSERSVYHIEVRADGFPKAVSARQQYERAVVIDSILNGNNLVVASSIVNQLPVEVSGNILSNASGSLHQRIQFNNFDLTNPSIQLDESILQFPHISPVGSPVLVDPVAGSSLGELLYVRPKHHFEQLTSPHLTIYFDYFLFSRGYKEYVEALRSRGGTFQDLNGLEARLDPVPDNSETGYGYFTIVDFQRLIYKYNF